MQILVTGSRGVVGTELVKELESRGHDVFGCDLQHCELPNYYRCDVVQYQQIENVLYRVDPDVVYFLSAEFGRHNSTYHYEQMWLTNTIALEHILKLQERFKFRLVFTSSSEVYSDYDGIMSEDVPFNVPLEQLNSYALSKWAGEVIIRNAQRKSGLEHTIIRYFNLYGNEPYTPFRSVNVRFCWGALTDTPVTVYKGHSRTSTYVSDGIRTTANIIDDLDASCNKIYNIGGNRLHTIEELVDIIWNITGADRSLISYEDSEPMTTKIKKCDTTNAINDLGHEITVDLEEGLERTISWMEEKYGLTRPNKR